MRMSSQRFCLRWNNHQNNMMAGFDQLLHAKTFTDVTIAVDGQTLCAHKMVLSACSPYLHKILSNHQDQHPIVILKDVPYTDMKALLDFMYRGEVSVDQDRLTAFLRIAENLRIKGLTEVTDDGPGNGSNSVNDAGTSAAGGSTSGGGGGCGSGSGSAQNPPQLHRIPPYIVNPQQQQQQQQQSHSNLQRGSNRLQQQTPPTHYLTQQQEQQQKSLLSSALSSLPKRKRGRPRKLSGSSNGGNDYEGHEHSNSNLNDLEMGNGKYGNDSYSGNDDGSDDNQQNVDDLNQSLDSVQQAKKTKYMRGSTKQHDVEDDDDDNSASVQILTHEMSPHNNATFYNQRHNMSGGHQPLGLESGLEIIKTDKFDMKLPTISGLRICAVKGATIRPKRSKPKKPPQQKPVKRQRRVSETPTTAAEFPAEMQQQQQQLVLDIVGNGSSAAYSLPSGIEFFPSRQQQQQQQQQPVLDIIECIDDDDDDDDVVLLDDSSKLVVVEPDDSPLHYQFMENVSTEMMEPPQTNEKEEETEVAAAALETTPVADSAEPSGSQEPKATGTKPKKTQRRRVRRKAQSSLDDQAEHLTEMSVRGLDLFRYASITDGVYQCKVCAKESIEKTFKNKYSFQRHAFLYHEGKLRKVFPCPICSKEFSRPDKMKNHLKMTHEGVQLPPMASARDANNFSSFHFLMAAASSGDMHATLLQRQQEHDQEQLEQLDQQQQQQFEQQLEQQWSQLESSLLLQPEQPQELELAPETGPEPEPATNAHESDLLVSIKQEDQLLPPPQFAAVVGLDCFQMPDGVTVKMEPSTAEPPLISDSNHSTQTST